jgi:hypothetical protein
MGVLGRVVVCVSRDLTPINPARKGEANKCRSIHAEWVRRLPARHSLIRNLHSLLARFNSLFDYVGNLISTLLKCHRFTPREIRNSGGSC